MSEYRLAEEIVSRSVAASWEAAKTEWTLHEIFEVEEPETCLCGHYPIIEVCTIANSKNGNLADVGNCCVKKFLGLPSDKIFGAVKRIRKDLSSSLNEEAIEHGYAKGWLTEWERDFYLDIRAKRSLSKAQGNKKLQINESFAAKMKRGR